MPVPLKGLSHDNVLAVIALLGLMRVLDEAWRDARGPDGWDGRSRPRLSWDRAARTPVLHLEDSGEERIAAFAAAEVGAPAGVWTTALAKVARFTGADKAELGRWFTARSYRAAAGAAGASSYEDDLLAMLASDGCPAGQAGDADAPLASSPLNLMVSGQLTLGSRIRTLLDQPCTAPDMERCLFGPWTRQDQGIALRLDPAEWRSYALRADDPSKEPAVSEKAATALALIGFSLLPSFPSNRGLACSASRYGEDKEWMICWPLWEAPVTLDTLRLLFNDALVLEMSGTIQGTQDPASEARRRRETAAALRQRGVFDVVAARRFKTGDYFCYRRAVSCL